MSRAGGRVASRDSIVTIVIATVLASPVLVGIAYSIAASVGALGAGTSGGGSRFASVSRVGQVLGDDRTWAGLVWSLSVATAATFGATVAAITIAVTFRGGRLHERIGRALAAAPLPLPHLVAAVLGVWTLGQSGMLARLALALGLIATPADMPALVYDRWGVGLVLTMAWKETAFLSVVAAALLQTRTSVMEEVARTLGASEWATMRRVTIPLLWRGLLPAVVAVFVFVVGSYETAALLAPSVPLALPLQVAERVADPDLSRRGEAYVVTLLLLAIGVVAVIAHEWVRARWEPVEG